MRLDDASEYMDVEKWDQMKQLLDKYGVKPIFGIIPENKDESMVGAYEKDLKFWDKMNQWVKDGWTPALHGYDHCYEVFCDPCAVLQDPESGRTMTVITDCPGVQVYTGGAPKAVGKGGASYGSRSAVCLETQFFPDAVNHPEWKQPFTKAGDPYHSETKYKFIL